MADTSLVATGAVLCAASVVFGWIAVRTQREHQRWCAGRTKVDGVVSRMARRGRPSNPGASVPSGPVPAAGGVPVVRFRAANRVEYEIDAPEAPREVGAVVQVAYDPALPSGGRAVARTPKIGPSVFLMVIGAILVAVGASR